MKEGIAAFLVLSVAEFTDPSSLSPIYPAPGIVWFLAFLLLYSALPPAEKASSNGRWCAGTAPMLSGSARGPSRTLCRSAACLPVEVSRWHGEAQPDPLAMTLQQQVSWPFESPKTG